VAVAIADGIDDYTSGSQPLSSTTTSTNASDGS
jgi:hypothetical protein